MRVLLVEDELRLARSIRSGLEEEGFLVDIEPNGLEAEARARTGRYDVLVVDGRLPGQDGRVLLERLRAAGATVPALMLTAMTTVEDRVAGLEAGADDYLGKPFAFDELLARLRALLRRSRGQPESPLIQVGPLALDSRRRTAMLRGAPLELRPKEFALLELLASHVGAVVPRAEIVDVVWGEPFVSENAVDVTVSGLRTRIAEAFAGDGRGVEIETVRGVGYRLTHR